MTILAALGYEAALLVNQLLLMIFALFALVSLIDGDIFQLPVRVVISDDETRSDIKESVDSDSDDTDIDSDSTIDSTESESTTTTPKTINQ